MVDPGGEHAIVTRGLTKFYGRHRGVVGLDLTVGRGEVFGFLGPNGAGKSTTISLLMGLIRPSGGTATVLGLDCWHDRDALHRRVGFLPGELALYNRLTGRQVLDFLARLRGGVRTAVVDALIARFDADVDRPVRQLSMGNRQKLGLVQAFMHEPEVIVLDEPTLGLDPLVQREFQYLVREQRNQGRTVFLSSHTLSEVERVADRVGIIREGALVEVAEVDRLGQLAMRRIEFEFAAPVDAREFAGIDGVRDVTADGRFVRVAVEGPVAPLMRAAAAHGIIDIHTHEADLEEVFLAFYRDPTGTGAGR